MSKNIFFYFAFIISCLTLSCNNQSESTIKREPTRDALSIIKDSPINYLPIKYIDSFLTSNAAQIKKNNALKEHYEGVCTKQILPLIDKKGFYNDIPFKLVTTATNNGTAYGNFIYDEGKYFIKVQCIIKKKQLDSLVENETYFIKFKTYKFQEGVSFENSFSKIELPTVNAYLTDFKKSNG